MMISAPRSTLLATLAATAIGIPAPGQSLTTQYAANSGGALGGGVYFDVQVSNPGGIWVTALDTNTRATVPISLDVYLATTHVGNVTNPSAWALVASGVGVGQGVDNPTRVDVADFRLPPGNHGIALVLSRNASHGYSIGITGNLTYSNSDIRIVCGAATNVPFSGSIFNPRVWNGTLSYSGAGNAVASYGVFGQGCQGTNGQVPQLTCTPLRLSSPATLTVTGLPTPATAPVGVVTFGFSRSTWAGGTLPFGLGVLGAPGCDLLAEPVASATRANSSGSLTLQIQLPNLAALLDGRIYNQAIVVDAGANTAGLTVSNGGEGTIGR
ncbi:MAG: hypothetical protein IPM29_31055 [Planctomycetes bacterium]|nr:hypothetical protein [Planctomycetota bacterium]